MPQIIELTDRSGLDYLHDLTARARNMRQPLGKIGQDMALSAKQRFVTATDPDGVPWAPNSATTLTRYGSTFARKKNGSLTKRGEAKLTAKKPGTGETRMLATTINHRMSSDDAVSIGSPMIYANTFHYGAQSGEFGLGVYASRNGSFPIPWGNIPARRFLGLSQADRDNIVAVVRAHFMKS